MKKNTSKKPFFARLLEKQELDSVTGGGTLKYPSDNDEKSHSFELESIKKPPVDATQKYPSDGDENLV